MSGTATIKAVTDGTTTETTNQDDDGARLRRDSLAHVWEQLIYHTVSLGESALRETESLLHKIQQDTSYTSRREAAEALDMTTVAGRLREALDCLDIAIEHLSALNLAICARLDGEYTGRPMF